MITEEENNQIKEMVTRAIPFGEQCVWKKEHERIRRDALSKRIETLVEKAKQPFQPDLEPHFKPDLQYKT
jgi:hypothetical protein